TPVAGKEVVIRTSTPDDQLPAGTRVNPANAPKMAKLIANTGTWVLNTEQGASHYRLIGLEVAPAAGHEMINVILLAGWRSERPRPLHHRQQLSGGRRREPDVRRRRSLDPRPGSVRYPDSEQYVFKTASMESG